MAFILPSGTTGTPTGCIQYHRDILAPADCFARHMLSPHADDGWLGSAPIAFTFGLGMQLIFPLRFGRGPPLRSRPRLLRR